MSKIQALLIDDDKWTAKATADQFNHAFGWVFAVHTKQADCLEFLKTSPRLDLAVLDWRLGRGATSEPIIRELRVKFPETLLVMTSGVDESELPADLRAAVKFISKPYTQDQVQALLQAHLSSKGAPDASVGQG
jgi:DNA-binding response OmpR family regulator